MREREKEMKKIKRGGGRDKKRQRKIRGKEKCVGIYFIGM